MPKSKKKIKYEKELLIFIGMSIYMLQKEKRRLQRELKNIDSVIYGFAEERKLI